MSENYLKKRNAAAPRGGAGVLFALLAALFVLLAGAAAELAAGARH